MRKLEFDLDYSDWSPARGPHTHLLYVSYLVFDDEAELDKVWVLHKRSKQPTSGVTRYSDRRLKRLGDFLSVMLQEQVREHWVSIRAIEKEQRDEQGRLGGLGQAYPFY